MFVAVKYNCVYVCFVNFKIKLMLDVAVLFIFGCIKWSIHVCVRYCKLIDVQTTNIQVQSCFSPKCDAYVHIHIWFAEILQATCTSTC